MGELIYGTFNAAVPFNDRALAHLQVVMGSKLRRHESFFFTWAVGVEHGGGRDSIWVDGAIPLRFLYETNARETLNRDWIELLSKSANSATGLQFLDEPVEPAPHTTSIFSASTRSQKSRTPSDPTPTRLGAVAAPARHAVHAGR
jgi:hypothetical protein